MDTGTEEGLVRIDVADAYNNPSIHEKRLDRCAAAPCRVVQVLAVEAIPEWFRPQVLDKKVVVVVAGSRPVQRTEAARVIEPKLGRSLESDNDMIVRHARLVFRNKTEAARHTQMPDQYTSVEAEDQILRPPLESLQTCASHQLPEIFGHRPSQSTVVNAHLLDPATLEVRCEPGTRGLDFR